ncbi:MAG: hypothetical protein AAF383_15285 [Cyanobacteria bacterium P01_A01_bin.83]
MSVAVIYAWTLSILSSISLLVKINIIDESQQLKFYPIDFFFSGLVGSLLLSILVASIGVLVSFKAESIKQAYKRVTMAVAAVTLFPSVMLLIAVFLVSPSMQLTAVSILPQSSSALVMLGSLAVFDSILIAWVLKLFERSHLMSD